MWFYKVVESETFFCCAVVAVEALVGLLIQSGQVKIFNSAAMFVCLHIGTCVEI